MKKKKEKTLFGEIEKIRRILGNDYHLGITWGEVDNIVNWALYRKYLDSKVYFSKDNEPIMTSDNYQLEDLYNYAKSHRKINIPKEFSKICTILAIIAFIIIILNIIFFKNRYLTFFIFGFDVCFLILDMIVFILDQENFKVKMLELDELFLRDLKEIEEIKPQKKKVGRPKKEKTTEK